MAQQTIIEFLSSLRNLDVRIRVVDNQLHINAPAGVLTPELQAELKNRKAEILAFLNSVETIKTVTTIQPVARDGNPPLSFAQQQMWFLDRLNPGNHAYNMPAVVRLSGKLDRRALEKSIAGVVSRHEILRTVFPVDSTGQPFQYIAPELQVPLRFIDLRQQSEVEVTRQIASETQSPFDLSQSSLIRALLLQSGETEHILVLTLHHIISDGWAMGVLVGELTELYQAFVANRLPFLPDLFIQYADFAIWQRQQLQNGALEKQRQYWQQQLAGLEESASLPTDHPRRSWHLARGGCMRFTYPATLTQKLKTLSQESGSTLFSVLLAAFNILLARYSGLDDISVGTFSANRNWGQIEALVGVFINTLVLRTHIHGYSTFQNLLRQVYETTAQAHANQDLPFDRLVESLQAGPGQPKTLFHTMLVLQNTPLPKVQLPGLSIEWLRLERNESSPNSDLDLFFEETEDGLLGIAEYNADLFEPATITRMAAHLQVLLEAIATNPQRSVAELPILTETERQQLLAEWNATQTAYPQEKCLQQLFEEQAERTPEAVAVVFAVQQLRYGELNQRANQLAHHLRKQGVGPGAYVGLCVERSLDMVVGLLGILKAGGAYIPLDPGYPAERLAYMLQNAAPAILLTQAHLRDRLPQANTRLLCLDADWPAIAQESCANPISGATPAHPLYVIYTSGSTGLPKGSVVYQRGFVNLLDWFVREFELTDRDRVLLISSLSFDLTQKNLYAPLIIGGQLHLQASEQYDASAIVQDVCERGITWLNCTPSAFYPLVDNAGESLRMKASLRYVFLGGEPIAPLRFSAWLKAEGGRPQVVNTYGPTECTDISNFYRLDSDAQGSEGGVPIGKPISNVQVFILDRHQQLAAPNVIGELCVGGEGVGLGYLNNPNMTAEKFVPDCFSGVPGARLYRTGDLARWIPDGNIEYLGRIDHQVKLRGFRIELGEIEAVLSRHPSVSEAVALAREDAPGEKRLVAYLVPREGQELSSRELRRFLSEKLPEYMIPSIFLSLQAMPLNPNGKVDRKALPVPDGERSSSAENYAAPRNAVEEILSRLWAEVLGLERVGIHDNFFELGGDSILSLQIITRAQAAGLQFTPRQIFERRTIAELAEVAGSAPRIDAEQGFVNGAAPLTPIQRWFFEKDLADPQHWNQALLLKVLTPLEPDRLAQAWQQVFLHHDALRAHFTHTEAGWQQVYDVPEQVAPLQVIDLSGLASETQTVTIEVEVSRLQASLNLGAGPLARAAYFDLGSGRAARLFLVVHHLVVDGVSWRILLEDLLTAYSQLSQMQAPALPPKSSSFRAWAEQIDALAQTEELQNELNYWRSLPWDLFSPLPLDKPTGLNLEDSTQTVTLSLSAEETRQLLVDVPEAYHTQINDVLLTALGLAFARWTGNSNLLVDLEGHGREDLFEDLDLSRTVGWFTSIFPLFLQVSETYSLGEALKNIKETLRSVPRRGVGYGVLRYLCQNPEVKSCLRALPPAPVIFNYFGQLDQALGDGSLLALADESVGRLRSPRGQRTHLIEIHGSVLAGRLQLIWHYSANLHERVTIEQLAQWLMEVLSDLIAHCLSPEAGGYTPSDFSKLVITRKELDDLVLQLAAKNAIEDLYPLSPMQQGMLFHSLSEPASGVYFEQLTCTFSSGLNLAAFEWAWQRVVERHTILRSAFRWERDGEPFQIVYRRLPLSVQRLDWRSIPPDEQSGRMEAYWQAERQRGFDLASPPLMRLSLIRLGDDIYHFVWGFHHLLLDGWSWPLLMQEVFAFYEAFSQGRGISLPPPKPFGDYLAWLQRQDLAQSEAFWRHILQGFSAPTPLGVDRGSFHLEGQGDHHERHFRLPVGLTAALQALAKYQQLTLNTLMQGVWALILSRYSRQQDVLFGVTVSGRSPELRGAEQMIGMFINSLPLRVQVSPSAPLLPWLQTLQDRQAEMRQYEYSALVHVQGWSSVPRGQPLFESLLVFENYPGDAAVEQAGQRLAIHDVQMVEQTNYPLTIVVMPGSELKIKINYVPSRFDEATIERMAGHFQALLEEIVADPRQRLSELSLLTEAEQRQMLVEWNATETAYPKTATIHQLFEAQVEKTPGAVALVFEGQQLTYAELNERANQLAHYLQSLGVGPDVLVGICVERSLEMVIGLLGILKAGGAYVPLDPAYPKERLAYMLGDAKPAVLLTQQHLQPALPAEADGIATFCLDTQPESLADYSTANPDNNLQPDNLAYVIYTSGSTGRPKGIMIQHRSVLNLWNGLNRAIYAHGHDSLHVSLNGSISFDTSVKQWIQLLNGHTLYILPEEIRFDAPAFISLIQNRMLDVLDCTPSQLRLLVGEGLLEKAEGLPLQVLVGGEVIDDVLWPKLSQSSTLSFYNVYGPTECTVDATVCHMRHSPTRSILGRPLSNTQIYIVDERLNLVPIGVSGELCISGVGVARGYRERPALTAEKFIPNPFSNIPGTRMYKSGDLARYLSDGSIEFLGRIDHQVKIRGFRIELGEIETVLSQHPAVREAVVVPYAMEREAEGASSASSDSFLDKRLVAYLVPSEEVKPAESELRRFLKETLPEYMIPSAFVMLEALPLTPNGKVDRRALPAPEKTRPQLEKALVAPRTPVEEMLAGIWADILGVGRVGGQSAVGVQDNFFELGGHSLLVTQVISRVRNVFQVELPLRELFESPTIAGLAQRIEAIRRSESGRLAPPLVPVAREGKLETSFAQQRLWFLDQLEPGSAAYNIPAAIRAQGKLDVTALQQSLDQVVQRHETLRTTFAKVDGQAVPVIAPALRTALPMVDLREISEREQDRQVQRLATEEAQRPFDLAHGPLMRACLLRLGEQDQVLLLTMHHIISDGWSIGVLIREMAALYRAFSTHMPSSLAELPIQYADFAAWQRHWLSPKGDLSQGEVLETQLTYWKRQLAGAPASLDLPTDRPRPAIKSSRGAAMSFELGEPLTEALKALSRRERFTLFMTLLAAFKVLLQRYTRQADIVVGTPIANRHWGEIEGLVGFFVNTLAMRTDLSGNPAFRELVTRVREAALGAYANQDLPFEMLVGELRPERDLSRTPLFQVMFVLQNAPMETLELPGLTLSRLEIESGAAQFDLTLSMTESNQGLSGRIEYDADLFDASTMERLARHFQVLLEGIVADPEQRISDLQFLADNERRQLLIEWNDTRTEYPKEKCIHELIEEQVEQRPDTIALVYQDGQITYRELNDRANQLARYLQSLGVEPDALVGICMERSLEMVVGLLGILKAGGAYVPLDPTYPPERLAYMMSDAQTPVLLVQAKLVPTLPEHRAQLVCLDTEWEKIARQDAPPPNSQIADDNLAYVIYTSGSTGKPKGAMNTHGAIRNRLLWMQEAYQLTEADRVMQKTPFSFDVSVWEFFWPLLTGACLVVARPEGHKDSPYLIQTVVEQNITTMHFVPSMLQVFVEERKLETCHGLKRVICSGEALPFDLQERFFARLKTDLHNLYGPTEAAVDVTFWPCQGGRARPIVPIGFPIANTQIYLLDARLQPVPIGVPGELYIGGVGLARGYHNRPDLTAAKFIPHPFSPQPGTRLYRTGDLARYLSDGSIEFLGRIDHQVKIRGFRIELGEIETVLSQHPAVREAVVVPCTLEQEGQDAASASSGSILDKRLVAYLVPMEEVKPTEGELRRFLKETLPEYMVPSAFVMLEALPLTPNGKVDRRALPAPEKTRPELDIAFVSPRSEAERTIAAIWKEVLNVEQVGVYDNFFDLGGHSLLVVQMHSRLTAALGRECPIVDLFKYTTVAALAEYLSQTHKQADVIQVTQERAAARRTSLGQRARGRLATPDK